VLATTNADGSAQMSAIFVKPDGDDILFSTIAGTGGPVRPWPTRQEARQSPAGFRGRSAQACDLGHVQAD